MTTAQEVEQYANRIAILGMGQSVALLRQYAAILRQTTEGTEALAKRQEAEEKHLLDRTEQVWQLNHTEQIWGLCRTYEQRLKVVEAENARLKAAMDKYSEELIERCAKVCEVMGFKHSECPEMSEYCADAIRALAPRTERT